jgi:hypothetical protein
MDAAGAATAPESLDDTEAAAFYISYQTGWFGCTAGRTCPGRDAVDGLERLASGNTIGRLTFLP